jgi:hypothetical protein
MRRQPVVRVLMTVVLVVRMLMTVVIVVMTMLGMIHVPS